MRLPKLQPAVIAACLVVGPGAIQAQPAATEAIRGEFDGSEYIVYAADGISWEDARDFVAMNTMCTTSGVAPHLATLTRAQEDEFVEDLRQNQTSLRELWIGGSQMPSGVEDETPLAQRDWFWENGEGAIPGSNSSPLAGYRNWRDGEPNDNTGAGSEEHLAIGLNDISGWNDEGNLGNIDGFVAECDAFDNNGFQLLTENDGDGNIVSVGAASTGVAAVARADSCIICRPSGDAVDTLWHASDADGSIDLRPIIASTESCAVLDEAIPGDERLILLRGQRGFIGDNSEECFTASLVRLRDSEGNPVDAVDGPVLQEALSVVPGQPIECEQAHVDASPFSLGTAIGDGQNVLIPDTLLCNRSRTATRYSDRFQIYDARLDPDVLSIRAQLAVYSLAFNRQVLRYIGDSCVDRRFLRQIQRDFNRAILRAYSRRSSVQNQAIDRLQDLAVFSLNVSNLYDPYREADALGNRDASRPLCPGEAKGELSSKILSTSYLIWRGILFPDTYENYALDLEDQTALRCLLPPFPTPPLDAIPAACADPATLPPPFMP